MKSWVWMVAMSAAGALLGVTGEAAAQAAVASAPLTEATRTTPMVPATLETARGLAMGLGARASASSVSGVAYNAAGMSINRAYHISSIVTYRPQASRFSTGGAVVDSHSGPVNMGASFRYIHGNGVNGYGGYDGRVALGVPIGDHFAVGATGRYMSFLRQGQHGSKPYAQRFTFDASVRVSPVQGLHIAALGYNLLKVNSSLVPMQVGGSISYTIDGALTLAFDGLADLSTWHNDDGSIHPVALFGGAVEYFTGSVPIRAGYFYDTGRNIHYVSAGLGWMNRDVGVDIAWRQQITGPMNTWLLASIRYFVH